jgi:pilus assembly protein CpaE
MMLAAKLKPQPSAAQMPAGQLMACVVDEVTRETVRSVAVQLGWQNPKLPEGGAQAALGAIRSAAAPALLIVDISDSEDPLGAVQTLAGLCGTETRIIAIGFVNDVGFYRRLVEIGAADYLVKPISGQMLSDAIQNATRHDNRDPARARPARVVAMIGARGGVGATTLAISVASTMAEEKRLRVVLLDLDLHFGNLALSLDIEPGRGLREILSNPDRIDGLLIRSAMSSAGERLRILAAEEPLEDAIELGHAGLDVLVGDLGGSADCIVIDTPRALNGLNRHVLGIADVIGVVTEQSLTAMRDTQRLLGLIKGMRADANIAVIANRVGGIAGEVGRADFERGIGARIDFTVPFDPKAAAAAAERAKALVTVTRDAKTAAELKKLAVLLAGTTPAKKPSFMKRILRK